MAKPPVKITICIFLHAIYTNRNKGIIIGFYLRTLCIFFPKYLDDEFDNIEHFFLKLLYPKPNIIILPYQHIILPCNFSTNFIENTLNYLVLKLLFYPPKLFIIYLTRNLINILNLIMTSILFLAITVK